MKTTQQGFTLIELVMVIVILGILAATAIPRFVDLSTDAANAALRGVAGSLASASAINYATVSARGVGGAGVQNTAPGCTNVVAARLVDQFDATTYSLEDVAGVAVETAALPNAAAVDGVGDTWTCTVTTTNNTNIPNPTFTLHWAQ